MNVDFAFVCDSHTYENDKLDAKGISVAGIGSTAIPFTHPQLDFVAGVEDNKAGQYAYSVVVQGPKGVIISRDDGTLTLAAPSIPGASAYAQLRIRFVNLSFEVYGQYLFRLSVAGLQLASKRVLMFPDRHLERSPAQGF